ncbi:MAG TPA: efflux transporter outer membrane subunit [Verrucomicrobiae bacterium]|nr:efflux transporter outer membrane subunit [Verrucomicrobiae bacterium]
MKPMMMTTAICLALLTGCAVGPNYKRPNVSAPTSWASTLADGETNNPANLAAWWENFHDPELDSLISRAVQSNLVLRVAEARIREARAKRGVVASREGPDVRASGSYSRNRYSQNGFPPLPSTAPLDYNLYRAGFDASWELDLFGGTRRAVEAANAEITATEFGRDDVLRSLLGEVAQNYIQARTFQQRLAITEENIEAQRRVVSLTRNRYQSGLSSDLDVQQAEALLASTESEVPTLETGFSTTAYHLDVLLGQPSGKVLGELTNTVPIPATPPQVPVGLPSDLLLRRPDVRRAERELAAATARIGQAKSDFFPKFSLTGNVGVTSIHASDWWDAGSRFWSAGPSVVWPIFESGRIRANVHVQNVRQEEALNQYQQTVLVAFEDVNSALTAYAKEQIRRQSLAQAVQANQRALALADDLYRQGLTDFIRVLISQRGLYLSQDALAQSDQAVAVDLVALYKALGGGWEPVKANQETQLSSTLRSAL